MEDSEIQLRGEEQKERRHDNASNVTLSLSLCLSVGPAEISEEIVDLAFDFAHVGCCHRIKSRFLVIRLAQSKTELSAFPTMQRRRKREDTFCETRGTPTHASMSSAVRPYCVDAASEELKFMAHLSFFPFLLPKLSPKQRETAVRCRPRHRHFCPGHFPLSPFSPEWPRRSVWPFRDSE